MVLPVWTCLSRFSKCCYAGRCTLWVIMIIVDHPASTAGEPWQLASFADVVPYADSTGYTNRFWFDWPYKTYLAHFLPIIDCPLVDRVLPEHVYLVKYMTWSFSCNTLNHSSIFFFKLFARSHKRSSHQFPCLVQDCCTSEHSDESKTVLTMLPRVQCNQMVIDNGRFHLTLQGHHLPLFC